MSVLNSVRELCETVLIINRRVVLNRLGILEIFCPKKGRGFRPSAAYLYPNIGRVPPTPLTGYPAEVTYLRLVFETAPGPPEVRVEILFNLIGK